MRTATRVLPKTRLIALGLAGFLALSACSSGSEPENLSGGDADWAVEEAPSAPDPGPGDDGGADAPQSESGELPPADLGDSAGPDGGAESDRSEENIAEAGRSVITEGTIGIMVEEDPLRVAQRIISANTARGGWLLDQQYRAADEYHGAQATVVLGIPSGQVGNALESLAVYGTIMSTNISRVDVTTQLSDLDARITAMERSVERMAVFLDEATTRAELLEAEQMFTDRQAQLEALLSQRSGITGQVSMSTITVELWTLESAPPPEPEPEPEVTGFWAGLTRGWNAFYDFGSRALLVIGTLTPWLVFLALLLAVVLVVRRPVVRWQEKRAATRPPRPARPTTTLPPAGPPNGPPHGGPMAGPGQPPAGTPQASAPADPGPPPRPPR